MWSTFSLAPGTTYVIRFPGVNIYTRANDIFWGVASEYAQKPQRPALATAVRNPPKDLVWKYSALLGAAELTVRPMLSPLPYEVEMSQTISILPGVELDGYMFLPLQAEILLSDENVLASVPLQRRKKTWFGSPQEGILCEAVVSNFDAAEEVGQFLATPSPSLAVCPISIKNDRTEGMELSRLCIPTDNLSIYGRDGICATDRVLCSFTADGLQIKPKRGMDPLMGSMEVLHPARIGPEVRIFSRGMDILRYIAGI